MSHALTAPSSLCSVFVSYGLPFPWVLRDSARHVFLVLYVKLFDWSACKQTEQQSALPTKTPCWMANEAVGIWKERVFSFLNDVIYIICIYIYGRIFDNVINRWTFCVEQFLSAKNYLQSSYNKRVQPLLFSLLLLSFSSLFLFLLSFSFVTMILELLGLKKTCTLTPFHSKWLQISLGWFLKHRLDIVSSLSSTVT